MGPKEFPEIFFLGLGLSEIFFFPENGLQKFFFLDFLWAPPQIINDCPHNWSCSSVHRVLVWCYMFWSVVLSRLTDTIYKPCAIECSLDDSGFPSLCQQVSAQFNDSPFYNTATSLMG